MASRLSVHRSFGSLLVIACLALLAAGDVPPASGFEQTRHELVINARRYEFSPARIEAVVGDVIKVTLVAEDIPHTFTIDEYRISKRAAPDRPITFEFHAARAGTFDFYCNLSGDDGCRQMRGRLVVAER